MVHSERSMTKREFAEIARATLDQMGKSDYKVVMIDSPVEAALETPEAFMQTSPMAYTTTDTVYFYWYYLKHFTYSYQLATIRHETVHMLSPSITIDESTGLSKSSRKDWSEYFKSFSFPKEEFFSHEQHSEKDYNAIVNYTEENIRSPKKINKVRTDIRSLTENILKAFYDFDNFFRELIPETNKKLSEEESFLKDIEDLFS